MVTESLSPRGRITARIHDTALLTYYDPTYPALPKEAQEHVAKHAPPLDSHETTNTTCVGLHEWLADALNGATVAPPEPSDFALGKSNTDPLSTDTELGDEVARVDISNFAQEGATVYITAYVGEDEANVNVGDGETISEGGIYAADRLLNHSLFDIEYEKDATKTMNVEAVFTFSAK